MAGRYSQVEVLTADHDVGDFDCGSSAQTQWLRRHALMAQGAGTSRVYVVRRRADDKVAGYFALATGSVMPQNATPRFIKGAGNYPQPVIILTRLGVDVGDQGHGLGRALLREALFKVVQAAEIVGIRGLLIHAEDEEARGWYTRIIDFEASPSDPLHLLLLMKDLRKALPDWAL